MTKKKKLKYLYWIGIHGLAVVGLVFMGVFVAIRFKLVNETGKVDVTSDIFSENASKNSALDTDLVTTVEASVSGKTTKELEAINQQILDLNKKKGETVETLCNLEELSYRAPKNVAKILVAKNLGASVISINQMIFAMKTHIADMDQYKMTVEKCMANFDANNINEEAIGARVNGANSANIFVWSDKKEWQDVKESIVKDKQIINRAAKIVGIEPRIIVANLMVEQLRLFYTQRELYKKFFEPLKILANSYKISLGVMAIKEETAINIENHLKDENSPYYLGKSYEHLLDFPDGVDIGKERFNRLSSNDHSWNYLYGALYLKQLTTQWKRAGYDLTNRPEIVGTLFNVGFPQSKPNANPKVGGSTVKIDGIEYSFGRLSFEFYYSGEMLEEFPLL